MNNDTGTNQKNIRYCTPSSLLFSCVVERTIQEGGASLYCIPHKVYKYKQMYK